MLVKIDSRGRITLPKAVLKEAQIKPGDKIEFRAMAFGGIVIEKVGTKSIARRTADETDGGSRG